LQAPFQFIAPHVQATSTGTADAKTLASPPGAKGFLISVMTNGAYFTFDGTTPSSTDGLHIVAGTAPVFIPIGKSITFASDTAGNAVVSVAWCG